MTNLLLEATHLMGMFEFVNQVAGGAHLAALGAALAIFSISPASAPTSAQPASAPAPQADHYYEPLAQETGAAGLKLMLRRLQTTGRLMQTTAHPDDEDGGMLTLEARGQGVSTMLMTLTRGEGGQNKLGSNLFDALGVLRTLELLAADRYYGVDQRFSRVADFGYSKTPEETFQKWQGHDIALADLVRVIRQFHPDVLVARFSGTDRDGHGHHQASAILTREAFHAAADPAKFPEQIKEGLAPWQAKKLYMGNVCGFGATTCDAASYTLRLNTGVVDPALGTSYIQFAMEGLRHQQSQGAASWTVEPGDRYTFYKLIDTVVDSPKGHDGHEQSFFDGIDTTLPGLAARLGEDEKKVPWLRRELTEAQAMIAAAAAEREAQDAIAPLETASRTLGKIVRQIGESGLSPAGEDRVLSELAVERSELNEAINLALGFRLHVLVDAPAGSGPDDAFMAVPGSKFEVTARLSGPELPTSYPHTALSLPEGWSATVLSRETAGNEAITRIEVHVSPTATPTRPYWHRSDPEREALNTVDDARYEGLPFAPAPLTATATVPKAGTISAVVMVKYRDAAGAMAERPLAVAPAFSVLLDPGEQVFTTEGARQSSVKVDVASNLEPKAIPEGEKDGGALRVEAPDRWRVEPVKKELLFQGRGERQSADFAVQPGLRIEGRKEIRAGFRNGHRGYGEGYSVVTREDLGTYYYYQPAVQRISVVDVKVPTDFKVGYVMGAGDEIPGVLQQIGMDITLIPAGKLGSEDLSKYRTVVLGIRVYDTQKDAVANNQRLLDFVRAGGRLLVQYDAAVADFNADKLTPYPATLSRARVSVEEAPVTMLDPANPIFHFPNEITRKDFEAWVQERGLYFMSDWDLRYTPLLESHDPGEAAQKGGLLIVPYGKGTYIYTGYAFFRQLPAGVPGAVRLFVNLVAGR